VEAVAEPAVRTMEINLEVQAMFLVLPLLKDLMEGVILLQTDHLEEAVDLQQVDQLDQQDKENQVLLLDLRLIMAAEEEALLDLEDLSQEEMAAEELEEIELMEHQDKQIQAAAVEAAEILHLDQTTGEMEEVESLYFKLLLVDILVLQLVLHRLQRQVLIQL
jgi:hypothetical protein